MRGAKNFTVVEDARLTLEGERPFSLARYSYRGGGTVMEQEYFAAGAAAARAGLCQTENPFLRSSAFPSVTGETIPAWSAKIMAWDRGWRNRHAGPVQLKLVHSA